MSDNDRDGEAPAIHPPQYFLPASAARVGNDYYNIHATNHWSLLQQAFPNSSSARPLIFMTILPFREPTSGTSEFNNAAMQRYNQIDYDLDQISAVSPQEGGVEEGAVNTAKALVRQLRSRELAPPEVSWIGPEAILMLWAIGEKRLALTITDGEFAYTLRNKKQTVDRASKINPETFDLLRLK